MQFKVLGFYVRWFIDFAVITQCYKLYIFSLNGSIQTKSEHLVLTNDQMTFCG